MTRNSNIVKRDLFKWTVRGGMWLATSLTGILTLFLVAYVLIQGIPNINWEFLTTKPSYLTESIGILPDILNTLYIVIATLLIVIPLGVGAAVYLTEYATNQRLLIHHQYHYSHQRFLHRRGMLQRYLYRKV